ncbi:MAG: hypothetical protein BYD32DRAFT_431692 [Podila humilis]|nr:MAG: hypothetical protein BYD32DRAFT_431692 [Podila humilis]
MQTIKCVVVGDGAVGKVLAMDTTAHSFHNHVPNTYIHTHSTTPQHTTYTAYTTYTTTPDIRRQQAWTCYRTRDWLDMPIILSMCSSPFPFCSPFLFLPACSSGLFLFVSFLSLSLFVSLSFLFSLFLCLFCFLLTPSSVSFVLTTLREGRKSRA